VRTHHKFPKNPKLFAPKSADVASEISLVRKMSKLDNPRLTTDVFYGQPLIHSIDYANNTLPYYNGYWRFKTKNHKIFKSIHFRISLFNTQWSIPYQLKNIST